MIKTKPTTRMKKKLTGSEGLKQERFESETFGKMISVVGSGVSSTWSGLASPCLEAVTSNGVVSVYASTTKIRKAILNMYKNFLNYFTTQKILKQER